MSSILYPLIIEQGADFNNVFIVGTTNGLGVVSTTGTTTVIGTSGTLFTKYFTVGNRIRIVDEVQTIATIVNDSQLTTSNAFSIFNKQTYGQVYNLTGCTFKAQIRIGDNTTELIATFTITITNAFNGTFELILPAITTANISPGVYQYDLFITYTNGDVSRLLYGDVTVLAQTTDPSVNSNTGQAIGLLLALTQA